MQSVLARAVAVRIEGVERVFRDFPKRTRGDPGRGGGQYAFQLGAGGRVSMLGRGGQRLADLVHVFAIDGAGGQFVRAGGHVGLQQLTVHAMARSEIAGVGEAAIGLILGDPQPGAQDLRPGSRADVLGCCLRLQCREDPMVRHGGGAGSVLAAGLQLEQLGRCHPGEIQCGQLLTRRIVGIEGCQHGFPIRHLIRKHVRILSSDTDMQNGCPQPSRLSTDT